MKDWTGNKNSIYKTLGASNHTDKERESNDFYATSPEASEWLLKIEHIDLSTKIWEPACGAGHISNVLIEHGYEVRSSDIVRRYDSMETLDFLQANEQWDGAIITNPPYRYAGEFIRKALDIVLPGGMVCMFLKVQFLEGKARKTLFTEHPPKVVHVSSSRILCAKNGEFEKMQAAGGSAVAYAWFVWQKGYKGETILKWFN